MLSWIASLLWIGFVMLLQKVFICGFVFFVWFGCVALTRGDTGVENGIRHSSNGIKQHEEKGQFSVRWGEEALRKVSKLGSVWSELIWKLLECGCDKQDIDIMITSIMITLFQPYGRKKKQKYKNTKKHIKPHKKIRHTEPENVYRYHLDSPVNRTTSSV